MYRKLREKAGGDRAWERSPKVIELVRDWRWIKIHSPAFLVHWIKTGGDFILLGRESSMARAGATWTWTESQWTVWENEVIHIKCVFDTYLTPTECSFSSLSSPAQSQNPMINPTHNCFPFSPQGSRIIFLDNIETHGKDNLGLLNSDVLVFKLFTHFFIKW